MYCFPDKVKTVIAHNNDEVVYDYSIQTPEFDRIGHLNMRAFIGIQEFDWMLLSDLYVDEEHRKEGIATTLLQHAIADAKANKCGVYLLVIWDNNEAINLYKKMGFRHIRDYYFKDHPTKYLVMAYGSNLIDQLHNVDFSMD